MQLFLLNQIVGDVVFVGKAPFYLNGALFPSQKRGRLASRPFLFATSAMLFQLFSPFIIELADGVHVVRLL